MAPKRSSVAGNTPPIIRSQTSVVVTSMTPDSRPRVDQLLHGLAADAGGVEHEAVVLALELGGDLLHAGRGDAEHGEADRGQALPSPGAAAAARASASRCLTMPAIACAPLASTWREMELSPCTSVTEYIIMMSDGPT